VTKISSVDKINKTWLPWQRPLTDRKTNFILIIYNHSSENMAKIGTVDFDIIGLTGIVKNK